MSETTSYPCPQCGAQQLVCDGFVRWRSGPRPPRSLAVSRDRLGFSPRADFDESAYYHCEDCSAEFVDHIVSSHGLSSLQVEGGGPSYRFNRLTQVWQKR
jgi:DNA-directed RNA polymerase subunit RPC12/RpoP